MASGRSRLRLNLVSDVPVPGPGGNTHPARRWAILSRGASAASSAAANSASAAASAAPSRSYLSFFSRTLTVVVVGVAATYAATKYALARIADIQRGITSQRRDSDNLRRRFTQNQEDCTFTILALLPTLDSVLAKVYDVDAITRELSAKPPQAQSQSQPAAEPAAAPASEPAVPATQPPAAAEAQAVSAPQEAATSDEQAQEPAAPSHAAELAESTLSSAPVELSTSTIQQEMAGNEAAPAPESTSNAETAAEPPSAPDASAPETEAEAEVKAPAAARTTAHANGPEPAVPAAPSAETAAVADAPESAAPAAPAADAEAAPAEVDAPASSEPTAPAPTEAAPPAEKDAADVKSAGPAPAVPSTGDLAPSAILGESAVLVEAPEPEVPAPAAPAAALAPPALSPEELLALKRRKAELWHELKIVAFTRTLTTLYSIVLLSLQTHIQLNLVGRFNYLSSVAAIARSTSAEEDAYPDLASPSGKALLDAASFVEEVEKARSAGEDPNELLRSVEQRYLTYSWWLLHRGALEIGQDVEAAVKHVIGTVPLKAELSLAELHRLVREVRRMVEWERVPAPPASGGEGLDKSLVLSGHLDPSVAPTPTRRKRRRHFLSAMFPHTEQGEREILAQAGVPTSAESELLHAFDELEYASHAEAAQSRAHARAQRAREDAQLGALVDESKDWIDSEDFERVLALCLERVFGIWEANLAEGAFGGSAILQQGSDEAERERVLEELSRPRKVRLAALLPAVNAQSRLATQSVPNEYAEALADVKELRALSALIYSSWST
ncbi:peroxin [Tilletia horrida]|nr:peroxin [Tilletia horrida]